MGGATGKSGLAFAADGRSPPIRDSLAESTHGAVTPSTVRSPLLSGAGQRDAATATAAAGASIEDFDIRVSVEFKAGNGNLHPLRHVVNNLTNGSLTPCSQSTQTKVEAFHTEIFAGTLPVSPVVRSGRFKHSCLHRVQSRSLTRSQQDQGLLVISGATGTRGKE